MTLRSVLVAALKSLLKGTSFLQALLTFWAHPGAFHSKPGAGGCRRAPQPAAAAAAAAAAAEAADDSLAKADTDATVDSSPSPEPRRLDAPAPPSPPSPPQHPPQQSLDAFLAEAARLLLEPVQGERLRRFARGLQAQFRERLVTDAACMLPSYNHQLPSGRERGRYLSLDVGGSTLRVALVALGDRRDGEDEGEGDGEGGPPRILRMASFKITPALKQLEGAAFFDWMAARIVETAGPVEGDGGGDDDRPLPLGLAWSFPIEQTSLRGGRLQNMGKGFRAAEGLLGRDLSEVLEAACRARGLRVAVAAIVNDSAAALLSQAYAHAATRFGLILGTGVNMAVHLPVAAVGRAKFGAARPPSWFAAASHVLVNTELGMFGHGLLPTTRWDARLSAAHPRPAFQPLEHMVSGYYLGEVCRLALLDAAAHAGLFSGRLPPSLRTPYALDTETLARIEGDPSPTLETATAVFHAHHPPLDADADAGPPSLADMRAVRALAALVARRSAALVAAAVYALWALKVEAERAQLAQAEDGAQSDTQAADRARARAELAIVQTRTVVAFNGAVIERYPRYRAQCQADIDALLAADAADDAPSVAACTIDLVPAEDSSLLGAAVALACAGA